MTDSYIAIGKGGTSFVGPDAVQLFAAATIRSAMVLYIATGMKASRTYTPKNMLAAASRITGKPYKRGRGGLKLAAADLQLWIDAMKAALPVEE